MEGWTNLPSFVKHVIIIMIGVTAVCVMVYFLILPLLSGDSAQNVAGQNPEEDNNSLIESYRETWIQEMDQVLQEKTNAWSNAVWVEWPEIKDPDDKRFAVANTESCALTLMYLVRTKQFEMIGERANQLFHVFSHHFVSEGGVYVPATPEWFDARTLKRISDDGLFDTPPSLEMTCWLMLALYEYATSTNTIEIIDYLNRMYPLVYNNYAKETEDGIQMMTLPMYAFGRECFAPHSFGGYITDTSVSRRGYVFLHENIMWHAMPFIPTERHGLYAFEKACRFRPGAGPHACVNLPQVRSSMGELPTTGPWTWIWGAFDCNQDQLGKLCNPWNPTRSRTLNPLPQIETSAELVRDFLPLPERLDPLCHHGPMKTLVYICLTGYDHPLDPMRTSSLWSEVWEWNLDHMAIWDSDNPNGSGARVGDSVAINQVDKELSRFGFKASMASDGLNWATTAQVLMSLYVQKMDQYNQYQYAIEESFKREWTAHPNQYLTGCYRTTLDYPITDNGLFVNQSPSLNAHIWMLLALLEHRTTNLGNPFIRR
jgi:hypothetical protein